MNTLSLLQTLYSRRPGIKGKALLLSGAIVCPVQTRRWLRFLGDDAILWSLAKSYPGLSQKIYRPYLSKRMRCADRVNVLIDHYGVLLKEGFGNFIERTALRPKTVCEFAGKSGTVFQIEISDLNKNDREGELSVYLTSNGVSIYHASFVFLMRNGEPHVMIGCLQGLRSDDGASHVRSTTRDLYGCRPKNLMAALVRDIGDYFGCKAMIGISNENKVFSYDGRNLKSVPDYDQTWMEMGAQKSSDGDFQLRCTEILKTNFDEIPSKKRAEAKRKNALLDAIFRDVRFSLDAERSGFRKPRMFAVN